MSINLAVVGAGNGGQAMAAYFAMNDNYNVRIFDFFEKTVAEIAEKGEIELTGAISGKGKIQLASNDMGKVVEDADLIMVVNPAIYHNKIAKEMAPFIRENQIIFLNPSSVFGAFAFKKALEDAGCDKKVVIGESDTLLFAARLVENGTVNIGGLKERLLVSAFPAKERFRLYEMIRPVIEHIDECETVLTTSFESTNAMVHPLPTIMNASWTESGAKFRYYIDGIGETVGNFIEEMDKERLAIGQKLGLILNENLFSLAEEYRIEYNVTGKNISEIVKSVDAYENIYSADTIRTRYIYEDIPTGMVAFTAMGELVGVPVKKMKLVTALCEEMLGEDLTNCEYSRNLKNLGLEGMSVDEIVRYAREGEK